MDQRILFTVRWKVSLVAWELGTVAKRTALPTFPYSKQGSSVESCIDDKRLFLGLFDRNRKEPVLNSEGDILALFRRSAHFSGSFEL
jgi:hypothetical protein